MAGYVWGCLGVSLDGAGKDGGGVDGASNRFSS